MDMTRIDEIRQTVSDGVEKARQFIAEIEAELDAVKDSVSDLVTEIQRLRDEADAAAP